MTTTTPAGLIFDFPSAGGAEYALRNSADCTALTFTFSDLAVKAETTTTLSSKVAWMPLPVRGEGKPARVDVSVSGYVFCGQGAGASLVFRLSGTQTTIDFPAGTDREYVATLSCSTADVHGQVNAVVLLVAQRDDDGSEPAQLDVLAVDAQLVAP